MSSEQNDTKRETEPKNTTIQIVPKDQARSSNAYALLKLKQEMLQAQRRAGPKKEFFEFKMN